MTLLLVLALLGADPAPPIPTALREAHTVYVINRGVHERIMANTIKALTQWHRWTLAADQKDADLTLTLSPQPTKQTAFLNVFNGQMQSVTQNSQFLEITAPDGTSLYGLTFGGNSPEKELKTLAKRLEEQ